MNVVNNTGTFFSTKVLRCTPFLERLDPEILYTCFTSPCQIIVCFFAGNLESLKGGGSLFFPPPFFHFTTRSYFGCENTFSCRQRPGPMRCLFIRMLNLSSKSYWLQSYHMRDSWAKRAISRVLAVRHHGSRGKCECDQRPIYDCCEHRVLLRCLSEKVWPSPSNRMEFDGPGFGPL